jgi:hypothetical protein
MFPRGRGGEVESSSGGERMRTMQRRHETKMTGWDWRCRRRTRSETDLWGCAQGFVHGFKVCTLHGVTAVPEKKWAKEAPPLQCLHTTFKRLSD